MHRYLTYYTTKLKAIEYNLGENSNSKMYFLSDQYRNPTSHPTHLNHRPHCPAPPDKIFAGILTAVPMCPYPCAPVSVPVPVLEYSLRNWEVVVMVGLWCPGAFREGFVVRAMCPWMRRGGRLTPDSASGECCGGSTVV